MQDPYNDKGYTLHELWQDNIDENIHTYSFFSIADRFRDNREPTSPFILSKEFFEWNEEK